jgi:hypothetical protein
MPFSLTNPPAIFQHFINNVVRDLLDISVVIYLDDIMVYTKTREKNMKITKEVFKQLRNHRLDTKPEKCDFFKNKIKYLGFICTLVPKTEAIRWYQRKDTERRVMQVMQLRHSDCASTQSLLRRMFSFPFILLDSNCGSIATVELARILQKCKDYGSSGLLRGGEEKVTKRLCEELLSQRSLYLY